MKRVVAGLAIFAAWLCVASERGDLLGHWTDQLRHLEEARGLLSLGVGAYRLTYGALVEKVGLLCALHEHLWDGVGIAYPPLGLIFHAPFAMAETAGVSGPLVHRAVVGVLVVVAAFALEELYRQLHGRGERLAVMVWTVPLVIGVGVSGFYDVLYFALGVWGLRALREGREVAAAIALSVAVALHIRALVLVPALVFAVVGLWRRKSETLWPLVALSSAAIVSVGLVAANATTFADAFYQDNRLYFARPFAAGAVVLASSAVAALLAWRGNALQGLMLIVASMLLICDKQVGFWHLLSPMLVVFAARDDAEHSVWRSPKLVALSWVVVLSVPYIHSYKPGPIIWLWL